MRVFFQNGIILVRLPKRRLAKRRTSAAWLSKGNSRAGVPQDVRGWASLAKLPGADKIVAAAFHQNVAVSPDYLTGTPEISGLLATGRMNRDTSPA
jgi:hypothetical protein